MNVSAVSSAVRVRERDVRAAKQHSEGALSAVDAPLKLTLC